MAKVTFDLIHNDNAEVVKSFNTLKDCVHHIRMTINDARKYGVDELEDGETVDTCSAYYLLENYKDSNKLPLSLRDCFKF
jgi:hypothetical protein